MKIIDLGVIDYQKAWNLQKEYFKKSLSSKKTGISVENVLIVCQHNPVYTIGKSGKEANLLFSKESLGTDLVRIERGGDVTFHGPGQLVVYPIIDLELFGLGVKDFIFKIEQVIINTLKVYNIDSERDSKNAGVWLDTGNTNQRKIAALGFKLSRFISMHGLALNINTDLSWFEKMVPCGIMGKGVTSMERELNNLQDYDKVQEVLIQEFLKEFRI